MSDSSPNPDNLDPIRDVTLILFYDRHHPNSKGLYVVGVIAESLRFGM